MIKVTNNEEVKETVLAGLKRNKEKYGKRYCSLERSEDVCVKSLGKWKKELANYI